MIATSILIGLTIGLLIDRNARRERDKRIKELEQELTVKQNVAEALNATVQRLRKIISKRDGEKTDK